MIDCAINSDGSCWSWSVNLDGLALLLYFHRDVSKSISPRTSWYYLPTIVFDAWVLTEEDLVMLVPRKTELPL